MKALLLSLMALWVASLCNTVQAQTLSDSEKKIIIAEAQSQLNAMAAIGGELYKFCKENGVTGDFIFDLTLAGKGEVLTLFMVSSTASEARYQNRFKEKLSTVRFQNIKIPKKQRIKFRHTLNF